MRRQSPRNFPLPAPRPSSDNQNQLAHFSLVSLSSLSVFIFIPFIVLICFRCISETVPVAPVRGRISQNPTQPASEWPYINKNADDVRERWLHEGKMERERWKERDGREREPRLIELKETVFHSSSLLTGVISHSLSLYCILYTCVCIYLTLSLSLAFYLLFFFFRFLWQVEKSIAPPPLFSCDRLACALLLNYCRADCTFPIFF